MTVEQMAREAVDLWSDELDLGGPSIEDRCGELYPDLDSFWFGLVEETAQMIAHDESYEFAFQCKRPTTGRHARRIS